jgi:hypothetical protein
MGINMHISEANSITTRSRTRDTWVRLLGHGFGTMIWAVNVFTTLTTCVLFCIEQFLRLAVEVPVSSIVV